MVQFRHFHVSEISSHLLAPVVRDPGHGLPASWAKSRNSGDEAPRIFLQRGSKVEEAIPRLSAKSPGLVETLWGWNSQLVGGPCP